MSLRFVHVTNATRLKEMSKPSTPSYLNFDKTHYAWQPEVDYRAQPELYKVGKGEQGVLICEPYKSEIVPHWHFRTPEIATESSAKLYEMFLAYLAAGDFVGADLARKFIQMGFTRARRYANYKGGRKYDKETKAPLERGTGDPIKAESAKIFYDVWQHVEANKTYADQKKTWKAKYG